MAAWSTARFLLWLRKMHGWIGLWGAALGLLFGLTGILMNHRTVMKIPAATVQESSFELALPQPAPASAQAMAEWLRGALSQEHAASRVKQEPSRPVAWGDTALHQPERWQISFNEPRSSLQVEYWAGNRSVSVRRSEHNLFGMLNNLHKGTGLGAGWVLLIDTLAGSIILLSLTGVTLWTQFNRRRLLGVAIFTTPVLLGIVFTVTAV